MDVDNRSSVNDLVYHNETSIMNHNQINGDKLCSDHMIIDTRTGQGQDKMMYFLTRVVYHIIAQPIF